MQLKPLMLRLWKPKEKALWCYLICSLLTRFKFEIFSLSYYSFYSKECSE